MIGGCDEEPHTPRLQRSKQLSDAVHHSLSSDRGITHQHNGRNYEAGLCIASYIASLR